MPARPFLDTLIALRFGKLHDELTEAPNELTNACTETGKGGTLTLSIKLKPGRAGQVDHPLRVMCDRARALEAQNQQLRERVSKLDDEARRMLALARENGQLRDVAVRERDQANRDRDHARADAAAARSAAEAARRAAIAPQERTT